MSDQSDRRNARAQALGYSSYSQQYRAQKAGHRTAAGYQASVRARASGRTAGSKVAAKLLGARQTNAGTVLAAVPGKVGQMSAQWDMIRRRGDEKHVVLVVEHPDGTVRHPGGRWGYSVAYLKERMDEFDSWEDLVEGLDAEIYGDNAYSGGAGGVVTATVR